MSLENEIINRSNNECEFCQSKLNLSFFLAIDSDKLKFADRNIHICSQCKENIEKGNFESKNWHFLNESVWSEVLPVKILSWKLLNRLKNQQWASDLLDIVFLNDFELELVKNDMFSNSDENIIHKDSNGAILLNGDSVVLIKDLNVKGGGFTAKRGTSVKNIRLVFDNASQIEGKINGQTIVILTEFVKK